MRRICVAFLLIIILMMGGRTVEADIFDGRSDQSLVLWFDLNGGVSWKAEIRVGPFEPQTVRIWSAVASEPDPSPVVIQFLAVDTGEELARLEQPAPQKINLIALSPDGRWLAVQMQQSLRLWDLQAVRAGLRELALDWRD